MVVYIRSAVITLRVTRVRSGAGIEVPLRFVGGIDQKSKVALVFLFYVGFLNTPLLLLILVLRYSQNP